MVVARMLNDDYELDEIREQIVFFQNIPDRDERAAWVCLWK